MREGAEVATQGHPPLWLVGWLVQGGGWVRGFGGESDDWSAGQGVAPQRRSTFHANISAQEHPVNTRAAPLRSARQGEHAGMRFYVYSRVGRGRSCAPDNGGSDEA